MGQNLSVLSIFKWMVNQPQTPLCGPCSLLVCPWVWWNWFDYIIRPSYLLRLGIFCQNIQLCTLRTVCKSRWSRTVKCFISGRIISVLKWSLCSYTRNIIRESECMQRQLECSIGRRETLHRLFPWTEMKVRFIKTKPADDLCFGVNRMAPRKEICPWKGLTELWGKAILSCVWVFLRILMVSAIVSSLCVPVCIIAASVLPLVPAWFFSLEFLWGINNTGIPWWSFWTQIET